MVKECLCLFLYLCVANFFSLFLACGIDLIKTIDEYTIIGLNTKLYNTATEGSELSYCFWGVKFQYNIIGFSFQFQLVSNEVFNKGLKTLFLSVPLT